MPGVDFEQVVQGHVQRMNDRRETWDCYRAAYRGEFWSRNLRWNKLLANEDALPVKVQTNLLRPFIGSFVSSLFLQSPKFNAAVPRVTVQKQGRPEKVPVDGRLTVAHYAADWLGRSDLRAQTNRALSMALLYGSAAFKLGFEDDTDLDFSRRLWAVALPPWEAIWDDRTTARERCRYMGHVRPEPVDWIEDSFGKKALKDLTPRPLPDYVAGGFHMEIENEEDVRRRDSGYLLVTEFYDLVDKKLKWAISELKDNPESFTLRQIDEDELPWEHADGRPAIPIEPIILEPEPEHPLYGLSACDGLYEVNAEKNLLLSYLASAFRRDAARVILYLKDAGLDEDAIAEMMKGNDLAFVGIAGQPGILQNLFAELKLPPLPASMDKYFQALDLVRQESKGTSDIAQGKQGKYVSATEAGLLAKYSDSLMGVLSLRMDEALNRTGELMLAITRGSLGDTRLRVDIGNDQVGVLNKELLDWPWTLELEDSSSGPAKEAEKKLEWQGIAASLMELVNVIATPDPVAPPMDPAMAAQGAPPPETPPGIPEPVKNMAKAQLDYIVGLWDLPEAFRWENLSKGTPQQGGNTPPEEKVDPLPPELLEQAALLLGASSTPPAGVPAPAELPAEAPPEVIE